MRQAQCLRTRQEPFSASKPDDKRYHLHHHNTSSVSMCQSYSYFTLLYFSVKMVIYRVFVQLVLVTCIHLLESKGQVCSKTTWLRRCRKHMKKMKETLGTVGWQAYIKLKSHQHFLCSSSWLTTYHQYYLLLTKTSCSLSASWRTCSGDRIED